MIDSRDRLYFAMLREPFEKVRTAFVQRSRVENDRRDNERMWLEEQGFEAIDIAADKLLTDDGREVFLAHGKAWALRPEVHAQRLAAAIEQAQQRDAVIAEQETSTCTQALTPDFCMTVIDGQLCGGTLSATPVCPKCALGKQGVVQILTCDICGAQTAVMQ